MVTPILALLDTVVLTSELLKVERMIKKSNDLTVSLNWLLSNKTQDKYSYDFSARILRRKNKLLWDLWPQVPFVDEVYDYIHVDGIHLGRNAVIQVIIKKPS